MATAPRIHLINPAGSCRAFFELLKVAGAEAYLRLVQELLGARFRVTGDAALIDAEEDEHAGGRHDDAARAADIQQALADDDVPAIVAIRGGAWFTRILRRIDFSILNRRSKPITVFGFSELTSLVNVVASHRNGAGVYGMCPAFLPYGLRRWAAERLDGASLSCEGAEPRASTPQASEPQASACADVGSPSNCALAEDHSDPCTGDGRDAPALRTTASTYGAAVRCPVRNFAAQTVAAGRFSAAEAWMQAQLPGRHRDFWIETAAIVCGEACPRAIHAELVRGELPDAFHASLAGGNLCVLSAMIGSELDAAARAVGRWVVLEDLNEKPERIDRFLAHLSLAGCFEQCEGLLVGDFHRGDRRLVDDVLALLPYHVAPGRSVPVLVTRTVGHIWPMVPLRLHTVMQGRKIRGRTYALRVREERRSPGERQC